MLQKFFYARVNSGAEGGPIGPKFTSLGVGLTYECAKFRPILAPTRYLLPNIVGFVDSMTDKQTYKQTNSKQLVCIPCSDSEVQITGKLVVSCPKACIC